MRFESFQTLNAESLDKTSHNHAKKRRVLLYNRGKQYPALPAWFALQTSFCLAGSENCIQVTTDAPMRDARPDRLDETYEKLVAAQLSTQIL